MNVKAKNSKEFVVDIKKISNLIGDDIYKYESKKYISPIINFLNSRLTRSYTRPADVGQLSDIFEEFKIDCKSKGIDLSFEGWKKFYSSKKISTKIKQGDKYVKAEVKGKNIVENVIDNIYKNLLLLKKILNKINKEEIRQWVNDLMFSKTFSGLYFERGVAIFSIKEILKDKLPKIKFNEINLMKTDSNLEAKGIDYLYKVNQNNILPLQIKTESADNDFLRNTSNKISKIPANVICCRFQIDKKTKKAKIFIDNFDKIKIK